MTMTGGSAGRVAVAVAVAVAVPVAVPVPVAVAVPVAVPVRVAALVAAALVLGLAGARRAGRAILGVRRASVARRPARRGENGATAGPNETEHDQRHRKSRPQHSLASLSCGLRQHSPL